MREERKQGQNQRGDERTVREEVAGDLREEQTDDEKRRRREENILG